VGGTGQVSRRGRRHLVAGADPGRSTGAGICRGVRGS